MNTATFWAWCLLALALVSCSSADSAFSSPLGARSRLAGLSAPGDDTIWVVDGDMGDDDVTALMLAVEHFELAGVTTMFGLTHAEAGGKNALDALAYVGFHNVSVYTGQKQPLSGNHSFTQEAIEWSENIPTIYGYPQSSGTAQDGAVRFLVELIQTNPGRVSILCLGPLTNIAVALHNPYVADGLRHLYVMGGGIFKFENDTPNRQSEWNMYIDIQAAQETFSSGVPITMLGLDVCQYAEATEKLAAQLKKTANHSHLCHQLWKVVDVTKTWADPYIYDVLVPTFLIASGLDVFTTQEMRVSVNDDGRTVEDPRGHVVNVVLKVDEEWFNGFLQQVCDMSS